MRFAGQRFRSQNESIGRFTAEDGSQGRFAYRYQAAGLPQSRNAMPEINAASMAKTGQADFQGYDGTFTKFG